MIDQNKAQRELFTVTSMEFLLISSRWDIAMFTDSGQLLSFFLATYSSFAIISVIIKTLLIPPFARGWYIRFTGFKELYMSL